MEERFLLDRVALGSGGVSPGNVEGAAAVVADFADAGLAFGDGAAVSAGEAAHAVVLKLLVEMGIGFDRLIVEDGAEGGHWDLWGYCSAGVRVPASGASGASGFRLRASGSGLRDGLGDASYLAAPGVVHATAWVLRFAQDDRVSEVSSGRGLAWRGIRAAGTRSSAFCSMAAAWARDMWEARIVAKFLLL